MKRKYNNIIALVLIVSVVISAAFMTGCTKAPKKNVIKLGLCLYRFDDTFISNVRQEIEEYVKEYEKAHDVKINLEVVDAKDIKIHKTIRWRDLSHSTMMCF